MFINNGAYTYMYIISITHTDIQFNLVTTSYKNDEIWYTIAEIWKDVLYIFYDID